MGTQLRLHITEINDNSGHEHIFIGTWDGDVVGRAALFIDGKDAELRVHIVSEYQNEGFGKQLTKHAIKEGSKYLDYIWLGYEEGNEGAKRLYEGLGFKYTEHRMELKCDNTESEL